MSELDEIRDIDPETVARMLQRVRVVDVREPDELAWNEAGLRTER